MLTSMEFMKLYNYKIVIEIPSLVNNYQLAADERSIADSTELFVSALNSIYLFIYLFIHLIHNHFTEHFQ